MFRGPALGDERHGLTHLAAADDMHREYGELAVTVEVVDSVADAVAHVNRHSSSHTDCIVTEDAGARECFLGGVDSACGRCTLSAGLGRVCV